MISILYNQNDYEAANIALKTQSLSQDKTDNIYIVPKHYGRNSAAVEKNLMKTKAAIFIAYETSFIDDTTLEEISILTNKGITVKYIIPSTFKLQLINYNNEDVYRFHPTHSPSKLINDISSITNELNTNIVKTKKGKDLELALIILVVVMLLGLVGTRQE